MVTVDPGVPARPRPDLARGSRTTSVIPAAGGAENTDRVYPASVYRRSSVHL